MAMYSAASTMIGVPSCRHEARRTEASRLTVDPACGASGCSFCRREHDDRRRFRRLFLADATREECQRA